MGLSKKEEFTVKQNRLAEVTKALAHPARIAIVEYLSKSNACMCGDIVEVLPLSQSTVSQHLRELKNAGLIKGNIEGTSVCYCIDEKGWTEAKEMLGQFLMTVEKCC
ncbi:MAG: winged helix-turn-helix transcriptional regulator [Ignavibacteriales bacterium]|nr:winged helix-turn-helix transcriptional regulator [Ignavibacteriales bacterium]